ncbi:uncharacterized protein MKK02DRAFT_17619 [Dioszegia hungarica]|uniref:UDENN domain-containing protein n=1 Tax=Dioszegia hungarica TaxID=4972 RepID=A0AA38LU13_9TREE|nr:uncharacterized protein MKK02DRAFT_17619 [Dioszegia hungarica]KAI9634049.1 hypothetical protein MKK02DRAFT_17619 [Dioszegia hungarica]
MPTLSSLSSSGSRDYFPSQAARPSASVSASGSSSGAREGKLLGKGLWSAPSWSSSSVPSGSGGHEVSLDEEPRGSRSPSGSSPSSSPKYSLPPPRADQRVGLGIVSVPAPSSANDLTPTKHRPGPLAPTPTRRVSSSTSIHSLNRSRSLGNRLSVPSESSPTRNGNRTPSMRLGWSRRPGEPRPPPMVEEGVRQKMERWVKEIVVCNFDLERGPVVERRAVGRRWGPGEKENVAFSSFPDTSLFAEGSILFSFKIRHTPPDPISLSYPEPPSPMPDRHGDSASFSSLTSSSTLSASQSTPALMSDGERSLEYRKWDERGREWLYGFVWFEQRKDRGIARGYMQKSLVILTHLPFPSLFFATLNHLAPVFFEHGYSALEAGCHSIANWPDPQMGMTLELPILSDLITVKLPDEEMPQLGPIQSSPILASLPPSTPLRAFANCLPALWSLWECLVLAEPVLVIAPDPKTCSEIVWWLRDLLRPIPPAGDFRPYLHIHDHDFSLLVNSNKPQPGTVVGVTNPFFRNAAAHWPNVISISDKQAKRAPNGLSSPKLDAPEGFVSRRQRGVLKDRALLKRLEALVAEGKLDDPGGNAALRLHFQQLTERFLVPLNRYFQTLVPTSSPSPTPYAGTQAQIKPWSIPNFLSHLKNHGPNPLLFRTKGLSTKSRVENDFYAAFCMSATFAGWLSGRIESQGLGTGMGRRAGADGMKLQIPQSRLGRGVSPPGSVEGERTKEKEEEELRQSSEEGSFASHSHGAGYWRASEESPRGGRLDAYGRRASDGAVKALAG